MDTKHDTARPSGPERPIRQGRVMSGLDYLRSMIEDAVPSSAFCGTLGIRLVEADHGRTLYLCEPSDQHTNALGISHGGLAAALIDGAGVGVRPRRFAGIWILDELQRRYRLKGKKHD